MNYGNEAANAALQSIFKSGSYSDLTVSCGEKRFAVHKAVVCARSSVFAKACEEGNWKEGYENLIVLEALQVEQGEEDFTKDDPIAISRMFEFIYTHSYDSTIPEHEATICHGPLSLHALLYAVGDKYDIPSLKATALRNFKEEGTASWNNAELAQAIKIAFKTTPDSDESLRFAVAKILQQHRRELMVRQEIDSIVRATDGLAYSLWRVGPPVEKGPTCNSCQEVFIRECVTCASLHKREPAARCFIDCSCFPESEIYHEHFRENLDLL